MGIRYWWLGDLMTVHILHVFADGCTPIFHKLLHLELLVWLLVDILLVAPGIGTFIQYFYYRLLKNNQL